MATKKNDGGSAFPLPSMKQSGEVSSENHLDFEERGQSGMSLRDYFAAKAMQAFIIEAKQETTTVTSFPDFADYAYCMADEMIKQRNK